MMRARKTSNSSSALRSSSRPRERWHNLLRYGALRLRSQFTDYAPTGIPYDSPIVGPEYIGAPVTIRGANGYAVSGQAIFQYVQPYPNQFLTSTDRDFVYAQTEYQVKPQLTALFGFRYEAERGFTQPSFGTSPTDRGNYSYTLQVAGSLANRFYYTLGSGIEKNAIFGVAGNAARIACLLFAAPRYIESIQRDEASRQFWHGHQGAQHLRCRHFSVQPASDTQ